MKRVFLAVAFAPILLTASCFTGMVNTRVDRVYAAQRADGAAPDDRENVNGAFPERVFIKTRSQTFNETYCFLISEGKIWYKSIDQEGDAPRWALFRGTGLPSAWARRGFVHPRAIVAISADANELQAISDKGRVYQYVFDPGLMLQDYFWKDRMGWPDAAPLEINDLVRGFRSWAVAKRTSSVLWYEDRFGNQHHYGTMGIETSYFLCADGQEIRFSDTGLPSDFSHSILGPERGRFIAESLSASASTMFVINVAGEMYTRLADFDTLGCDPLFFRYTYRARDYGLSGANYRSNYTPWGLPAEDWKKEPPIPLSGRARITRRITILQNGQGNDARELRVAGTDAGGRVGYYRKGIADERWDFVEAPLTLSSADYLGARAVASGAGPRGKSSDARYYGTALRAGVPMSDIALEIPDFNLGEGSCSLVVTGKGERATLRMHPVDAWTYLRRFDPGRDGMPKLMMVTVEIPDGALDSASPVFRGIVSDLFARLDREPFALSAEATTDYIIVRHPGTLAGDTVFFFSTAKDTVKMNPDVVRKFALGNDALIGEYAALGLDGKGVTRADAAASLRDLLARNREYRTRLEDAIRMYASYRVSSSISGKTYGAFSAIARVTFLYLVNFPKINTITSHGSSIMRGNEENAAVMAEAKYWAYRKVLGLLDVRLRYYSELLAAVERSEPPPASASRYSDDFAGYFSLTGIPPTLFGSWFRDGKAIPCQTTFELFGNDIPGMLVITREKTPRLLLIDFSNLPSEVFSRGGLDFASEPLKASVTVSTLMTPAIPASAVSRQREPSTPADAREEITATLEWDGKALTVWRQGFAGKRTILLSTES